MNKELCDQLNQVAAGYGNNFRRRAHTLAAATIARLPYKITDIEQVKKLPGIGAKILAKISEFLLLGQMRRLSEKSEDAKRMDEMRKIHGIGEQVLNKLWTKGLRSVEQLRQNQHMLSRVQLIGLKFGEETF